MPPAEPPPEPAPIGEPEPLAGGAAARREALRTVVESFGSVVVALSGGVDSATLAVFAHRVLGRRSLAVTGVSPALSAHSRALVRALLAEHPIPHLWLRTDEMDAPGYRENGPDRCFFCKDTLYAALAGLAERRGFAFVLDGENADDAGDVRPGRRAAAARGVRSPLREAGLGKSEVRALARSLGVPTAEEPASACLSSRIPRNIPITAPLLRQVEAGEAAVRGCGFGRLRVRHEGGLARIELPPADIPRALAPEVRRRLSARLSDLGFRQVAVDLRGYRPAGLATPADPVRDLAWLVGGPAPPPGRPGRAG